MASSSKAAPAIERAAPKTADPKPCPRTARWLPSNQALLRLQRNCSCEKTGREPGLGRTSPTVQTKVVIGPPDDAFEREANHVSERVMRMPSHNRNMQPRFLARGPRLKLQMTGARATSRPESGGEGIRRAVHTDTRKIDEGVDSSGQQEDEEEQAIRRKATALAEPRAPALTPEILTNGGESLSPTVRAYFEPRFGQDFSAVRTHSGRFSERANCDLSSAAFTYGSHIWLGEGQTPSINILLAHELVHVTQQTEHSGVGVQRYFIQRSCLPTAICPPVSVDVGGAGFNWEVAEICLQNQYPYKGVVGTNKSWKFLTGPPGTSSGRDMECFKSHLMAKSGMFLAEPDIIDFTRAEIYDVTTYGQAQAHAVRLWADVGEATALASIPDCSGSGRVWSAGTWQPSPCYAMGSDMFIQVENVNGLLLYRVLRDVAKELAYATVLAAIFAAAKNQLGKSAATAVGRRVPYVAAAYAAVTIVVLLTTDAELSWASEGDPVSNLIKAIENSGTKLPDEIKNAIKSDPVLREKIEAAAKAADDKTPSERAKQLKAECLKIVAENKDRFSREELETLLTVVEVTTDDKLPDKGPTVEALKKQIEAIRKGTVKDPGAGDGGTQTPESGPKPPERGAKGSGEAGKEKSAAGEGQGLKPETTKKIAEAAETARRLLAAIAGQTGTDRPMTDADVERFLTMVPRNLNPSDLEAILAKLHPGEQAPKDLLDNLSQVLAKLQKDKQSVATDELGKKYPKLSQAAREKLAANPLAAQLLSNIAASAKKGIDLSDDAVDRFLEVVGKAKSPEQIDAVAGALTDVKEGQTIDQVLTSLQKTIAKAAKGSGRGGGQGTSKGPGKGSGARGKGAPAPIAEQLARKLMLLKDKVELGKSRLEWDGKEPPVTGTQKSGCRFFGKTTDDTAYISQVTVQFTKVEGQDASYTIVAATKLYGLDAQEVIPDKPLIGRSFDITLDPEASTEAR